MIPSPTLSSKKEKKTHTKRRKHQTGLSKTTLDRPNELGLTRSSTFTNPVRKKTRALVKTKLVKIGKTGS